MPTVSANDERVYDSLMQWQEELTIAMCKVNVFYKALNNLPVPGSAGNHLENAIIDEAGLTVVRQR